MAVETGRDDFVIAIRSAFLKKGNRQKFSLFTLLIISILVLSLEYFKTGPIDKFRSFTKDFIYKGSFFISASVCLHQGSILQFSRSYEYV
jgi:rod shape-determining protein MreC